MAAGAKQNHSPGPVIALTGGSGFLGSHIADVLREDGYRVRAAVRPTSDLRWLEGKGIEIVQADLLNPVDCVNLVRGTRGVIHCAGLVTADNDQAYLTANVKTTRALLTACRQEWHPQGGASFVLISSLAAHGPAALDRPATENDPCNPVTGYGRSKVAAEELVLHPSHPFRTTVLRPPALYGPRDRGFLPLVKIALRGWDVRFKGPLQGLSLVHGRDAARAAVALLKNAPAEGVFFVDDGQAGYTLSGLADALGTACQRKIRTVSIPLGLLKFLAALLRPLTSGGISVLRRDRIQDLEVVGWACDGSRLRQVTGFNAEYDAARGLADALKFYREQQWL